MNIKEARNLTHSSPNSLPLSNSFPPFSLGLAKQEEKKGGYDKREEVEVIMDAWTPS